MWQQTQILLVARITWERFKYSWHALFQEIPLKRMRLHKFGIDKFTLIPDAFLSLRCGYEWRAIDKGGHFWIYRCTCSVFNFLRLRLHILPLIIINDAAARLTQKNVQQSHFLCDSLIHFPFPFSLLNEKFYWILRTHLNPTNCQIYELFEIQWT